MISLIDPLNFDSSDPENVISAIDKNYVNACMSMKKSGISDPKELTVFEWEIVIDNFEEELINKHKNDTL